MVLEERLLDLLAQYRDVVKPLMADIEVRSKDGKIPTNCLNEVRAMNDHIARCYQNGKTDRDNEVELIKAEGHLKRLIFDCFKQLNIFLYDKIEATERKNYSSLWLYWDDGEFWKKYKETRIKARKASIEAKKKESENSSLAMQKYEEAYCNYCILERMLNEKSNALWKSFFYKWICVAFGGLNWLISTIVLSLIASIITWVITH